MSESKSKILWMDCLGALVVGTVVLACYRLLSSLEGLPGNVVVGMGLANVAYGFYSLFVTTRFPRPRSLVGILAIANMAWLVVCALIVSFYWSDITVVGILHVVGEGIFVAGLGFVEWIRRNELGV